MINDFPKCFTFRSRFVTEAVQVWFTNRDLRPVDRDKCIAVSMGSR